MDIIRITPAYSVAPQIRPADVPEIARLGFRAIMCNRPDGEDPGQPDFAEIAAAAQAAGLATAHVPVSGALAPETVTAFQEAMSRLPEPVLAYCRSGTRCQTIWRVSLRP